MHAPKLRLPVGQISFFLGIDKVIVSGRRQYGRLHATLYPGFQINVFVERYIRPEVDQLNAGVPAADAVHASKALDDAHRVPVDVVVNQIVAVLKVLSLGNAVGRNQDIDIHLAVRHEEFSALGNRRKAGKHIVEGCRKLFYRALSVNASRDDGGIQSVARFQKGADLLIEILRGIGKCREDEYLFVSFVNRVLYFLRKQVKEFLQLAVVCGRTRRDQLNELV